MNTTLNRMQSKRTRLAAASIVIGTGLMLAPAVGAEPVGEVDEPTVTAAVEEGEPVLEAPDDGSPEEEAPPTTIAPGTYPHDNITIEKKTWDPGGLCMLPLHAFAGNGWSYSADARGDTFVVKITGGANLCEPVRAAALIYNMDRWDSEWPQTLAEREFFTLQQAGTYTITFNKVCRRVQFDITAGDSPAKINSGFDHSLLFPGSITVGNQIGTAYQHFGSASDCNTTTTTAPTTTVAETTTTQPAQVEGTTTIPSDVLAATTVPGGASYNNGGTGARNLAATGLSNAELSLIGAGLVALGGSMILARRRTAEA